jgi:acetyltransferase-like isoleucine patch superfamily enzyme
VLWQDIHRTAKVGKGTKVWNFVFIDENAVIGENGLVSNYVGIGRNVRIGNNVRIQEKVYIPEGTIIDNNVWIGPCVAFANEKYPTGKRRQPAIVEDDVIVGLGARIGSGVVLGKGCVVGQGSNVLCSIPADEVWIGTPARFHMTRTEYNQKRRRWQSG